MSILNERYLKEQLITYIVNKRRLLPLIHQALKTAGCRPGMSLLDLFSGSGSVSRLGRLMGLKVTANDWEEYARILGESHLALSREDLGSLFGSERELRELLEHINNLPEPAEGDRYMALYYAPSHRDIRRADFRTERLFYTRENALRIDAMRNFIEYEYPAGGDGKSDSIRSLLIGLLLGEASKHTNTSGVFKAYHKGFGGHGRDALSRILAPIALPFPVLPEGLSPAAVCSEDANSLVRKLPHQDLAYLDPPYNQHQYGSNYHILNTIALWDRLPAPLTLNEKGILREKAAIRKDWILTRSDYCYRSKARDAFADVMEHLDASRILISYSNDGLIPFETMMDICESKGRVNIVSNEYTKFRGGRQSNSRLHSNIEFVMLINCEQAPNSRSRSKIRRLMLLRQAALLEKKIYPSHRLPVEASGREFELGFGGRNLTLSWKNRLYLSFASQLADWPNRPLRSLILHLERAACKSRDEELNVIIDLLEEDGALVRNGQPALLEDRERARVLKEIPKRVRMLAHKKTRVQYEAALLRLEELRERVDLLSIDRELQAVTIQAEKRFKE